MIYPYWFASVFPQFIYFLFSIECEPTSLSLLELQFSAGDCAIILFYIEQNKLFNLEFIPIILVYSITDEFLRGLKEKFLVFSEPTSDKIIYLLLLIIEIKVITSAGIEIKSRFTRPLHI